MIVPAVMPVISPVVPSSVVPPSIAPSPITPPAVSPSSIAPERKGKRYVDADVAPGETLGALKRHPTLGPDDVRDGVANGAEALGNRRRRCQTGLRSSGDLTSRLRPRRAEHDRHAE